MRYKYRCAECRATGWARGLTRLQLLEREVADLKARLIPREAVA